MSSYSYVDWLGGEGSPRCLMTADGRHVLKVVARSSNVVAAGTEERLICIACLAHGYGILRDADNRWGPPRKKPGGIDHATGTGQE